MKQHNKIRRTWLIFSKQWKRKFPHYSTINFLRPPSAAGLKSTVGANHWADKKLEIMWLAWRLVAGQGLQVSPHDAILCRGEKGGGRSQRNKEMEMENAAAGSRYHYTHWRLCMQLNMRCKIVAKKSEMTKWLANFQLQNSICGLYFYAKWPWWPIFGHKRRVESHLGHLNKNQKPGLLYCYRVFV